MVKINTTPAASWLKIYLEQHDMPKNIGCWPENKIKIAIQHKYWPLGGQIISKNTPRGPKNTGLRLNWPKK